MFRQPRRSREVGSSQAELSVVDEQSVAEQADAQEIDTEQVTGTQQDEEEQSAQWNVESFAKQKSKYLKLLLRGASPAAACQKMGINLLAVVEYLTIDDRFREKVDAIYDALSQNVAAKLYQEAMNGSVPAMSQWLKNRPPPEWPDRVAVSNPTSCLDVMSDEELIRLARLEKIKIPTELEADTSNASSEQASEVVS